jgi:hypothetical protein
LISDLFKLSFFLGFGKVTSYSKIAFAYKQGKHFIIFWMNSLRISFGLKNPIKPMPMAIADW